MRAGGFKDPFITSFNVSWLRMFIIYSNNDSCSHLSKINFSKLFSLGDLYCQEQLKNIRTRNDPKVLILA